MAVGGLKKRVSHAVLVALLAGAFVAIPRTAAAEKPRHHTIEHVVEKGETLGEIAERYGVRIKDLKRWNKRKTRDPKHLSVGARLKIQTKVPTRSKRKVYYVVRRGDSLRRIARRLGVTVEHLRAMNRVRKDLIHPGDRLAYLLDGPEEDSESIGRPYDGRLKNGEKLPEGPGYTYNHRRNIYGTNETVTLIIHCVGEYMKMHPEGPVIVIGNLSQKDGGKFGPHASHQSGRDVDMGYMHKKRYQPVTRLRKTTPDNMDLRRTWDLLQCFLDTGKVDYMFINYELQEALYKHLEARKFKKRYLDRLFQYPRKSGGSGIIQHSAGHADHVHIRFSCPKGDKRCRD